MAARNNPNHSEVPEKPVSDIMPCRKTVSKFVADYVAEKEPEFNEYVVKNLKENGGGLTLDFATNEVPYFGSTVHFLNDDW